ncbi:MAG TPA: hypothetical protein PLX58_06255 [Smithellaceae bacterium]|jgi:hypothetical protein|nr:hypothetical protein [Smithellaceae bacterium]HQF84559.1 hypothetical protein [Smithellaceae bacterium]HQG81060.1 hypothetical protein [Smithellaceae bacterium]
MRKRFFLDKIVRYGILVIIILIVMSSNSILNASPEHQLTFTPENFDFGVLDEEIPAIFNVLIKNKGPKEVTIHNVRTN